MRLISTGFQRSFLIILMALSMFNYTCKKKDDKNCIDGILGTYKGTQTCPNGNFSLNFIITASAQSGQVIVTFGGTSSSLNGTVSNCSSINIPSQSVTGFSGTLNGTLNVNGTNLTGTLNSSSGNTCSYNLTKL
jgi:hypothetical protein